MKIKEIKIYAIQLDFDEMLDKIKQFTNIFMRTKCLGVHPDFPVAYALYKSRRKQKKAFDVLSEAFHHCKLVYEAGYISVPR